MTTPTGIKIIDCPKCGLEHPSTRRHCRGCGIPSLYITQHGICTTCTRTQATHYPDIGWRASCVECWCPYGPEHPTKRDALQYYATTPTCHECTEGILP